MISRVADHCFWFGRYVERAEATARMLSASVSLALDAELPPAQVWRPIVVVSGDAQAGQEGTALASPLVVMVTDAFGNATPAATTPSGRASASNSATMRNAPPA